MDTQQEVLPIKKRRRQEHHLDRISELPEPIVHQILSLLPTKEAARTSTLSKSWKHTWTSFPVFNFDGELFGLKPTAYSPDTGKNFAKFIDGSLTRFEKNFYDCDVEKFRLCTHSVDGLTCTDKWIAFSLKRNVKELDICLWGSIRGLTPGGIRSLPSPCELPSEVFTTKSIAVLKLEHCRLKQIRSVELPSLRSLSLTSTFLDDQIFLDILSGCPLIEDLRVIKCNGLQNIKVSSPKIKSMELQCSDLDSAVIAASNLQSFRFERCNYYSELKVNIDVCQAITNLSLIYADFLTDKMLEDLISRLPLLQELILRHCNVLQRIVISRPLLENLVLVRCKALQHIVISCQKLKKLSLVTRLKLVEAKIDTPNQVRLVYSRNLASFSSVNAWSQLEEDPILVDTLMSVFPCLKTLSINSKVLTFDKFQCEDGVLKREDTQNK